MVRYDLLTIIWWIQNSQSTIHTSGLGAVCMPARGQCNLYATCTLSEAVNGANYYTLTGTRQGQPANPAVTVATNQIAITAYKEMYLGSFAVGQGDVMSVNLVATGAPATTLLVTNFVIRCELTPGSNKNG